MTEVDILIEIGIYMYKLLVYIAVSFFTYRLYGMFLCRSSEVTHLSNCIKKSQEISVVAVSGAEFRVH